MVLNSAIPVRSIHAPRIVASTPVVTAPVVTTVRQVASLTGQNPVVAPTFVTARNSFAGTNLSHRTPFVTSISRVTHVPQATQLVGRTSVTAPAPNRSRRRVQVFGPGGGIGSQYAGKAFQDFERKYNEFAVEVVGMSRNPAYDHYPHNNPIRNLQTFAEEVAAGTFREYYAVDPPNWPRPIGRGTPVVDCAALFFGSRGGQVVLPVLWKLLGDAVPPAVVVNAGTTLSPNPSILHYAQYQDAMPPTAVVFMLVCGTDETFNHFGSPEAYFAWTRDQVPATSVNTAILYVKELTHMPDPTLMLKVYPKMIKSVIDWKETNEPPLDSFQRIVRDIKSTRYYTGELTWKVKPDENAWESFPI